MAYTSTSSSGRIANGQINVDGEWVELDEFARRLGFSAWDEFITMNDVSRGRVRLDQIVDARNQQVHATQGFVGRRAIDLPGAIDQSLQQAIQDGRIQIGDVAPSDQAREAIARGEDIFAERIRTLPVEGMPPPSGGDGPVYTLPVEPRDTTPAPNRQFFDGAHTRSFLVAESTRNTLAGQQITDIYRQYLPENK